MSDRFALEPGPRPDPAAAVARWREEAALLRLQADEVGRLVHDLSAYHRPDVWQGAVASRFGDDLERWRARLGDVAAPDGASLVADLLAAATRLEVRALSVEVDQAGGLPALWIRPAAS